jgi:uncharacterized phage-associated protein
MRIKTLISNLHNNCIIIIDIVQLCFLAKKREAEINQESQLTPLPEFNIYKTTEAVAYLLQLYGGDKPIKFMRILKLLYLADREALDEWERPITYDRYFSMDRGQILSGTYNLMKDEFHSEIWDQYIKNLKYYYICLKKTVLLKKLSPAEVELLNQIYADYGKYTEFELGRITKGPEYVDPHGSSIPTPIDRLLKVLGYDQEDIKRIIIELESEASIDAVLGA